MTARVRVVCQLLFFFNATATTEIYTLSLHDALPISHARPGRRGRGRRLDRRPCPPQGRPGTPPGRRSEEHTSELQSQSNLVCRLLLEKKKNKKNLQNNVNKLVIASFSTVMDSMHGAS